MNFSDFKRIMTTYDYFSLTKRECKIQAFVGFSLFFIIIGSFFLPFLNPNTINNSDPSALFFAIVVYYSTLFSCISFFIFLGFIQELDEKYGIRSKVRLGNSYQYRVLFPLSLCPPFFILIFAGTYVLSNLIIGFGICLSFAIPLISMFLRIKVFNDDSCISKDGDFVLGYRPELYFVILLIIGLYGYYFGFSSFSEGNFLSILWILFILVFQLILVFPDKLNNLGSCDLRVGKYCAIFLVSYLLVFIVFVILFQPILLNSSFSLFDYLSINWFLSKKGYLIIVCLFAYLVFRNYNKKS